MIPQTVFGQYIKYLYIIYVVDLNALTNRLRFSFGAVTQLRLPVFSGTDPENQS